MTTTTDDAAELPADLISTNAAARLVPGRERGKAIHIATVYRWIDEGRLRAWKVGGRLKVSESELRAMFRPVAARRRPAGGGETAREQLTRRQQDAATLAGLKRYGVL